MFATNSCLPRGPASAADLHALAPSPAPPFLPRDEEGSFNFDHRSTRTRCSLPLLRRSRKRPFCAGLSHSCSPLRRPRRCIASRPSRRQAIPRLRAVPVLFVDAPLPLCCNPRINIDLGLRAPSRHRQRRQRWHDLACSNGTSSRFHFLQRIFMLNDAILFSSLPDGIALVWFSMAARFDLAILLVPVPVPVPMTR